jgi:hypothetical protein
MMVYYFFFIPLLLLLLSYYSMLTTNTRIVFYRHRTPSSNPVTNGKREVTHVLLRHGASVLAINQQGHNVVTLAEKAANSPQATTAHSALHKLCQETAQKQQLQRTRAPPTPLTIPPPPSTTPPKTLLRQSASATSKDAVTTVSNHILVQLVYPLSIFCLSNLVSMLIHVCACVYICVYTP